MTGRLTRASDARHAPVRANGDWALAGAIASLTVLEVFLRDELVWRPLAVAFGITLACTMLWRRSHPLEMVCLAFGALFILDLTWLLAFDEPFVLYVGAFVLALVYSLFRWGSAPQAVIGSVIVLAEWTLNVTADFTGAIDAVGGLVVLLLVASTGLSVRYRRLLREQLVQQARLHERESLSRELHDTVAHHVSAIAVQAQAGHFLASTNNPDGAANALTVIETEASRALAEMRTIVESLRGGDHPPTHQSNKQLADLGDLATAQGAPGLPVAVEHRCELDDRDDVPPAVQAALYRVAQESITNAQRHARHATGVTVIIEGDHDTVYLSITDDGERAPFNSRSAGFGLVGMAERISLLGGTFDAGPAPMRGWTVRASVPLQPGRA
ncbi:MAG: sensor histidine kinase [Ornithinimicrobium sp.]